MGKQKHYVEAKELKEEAKIKEVQTKAKDEAKEQPAEEEQWNH